MNKDQLILEEMYMQMYDEGIGRMLGDAGKAILRNPTGRKIVGAGAALGLGAGAMNHIGGKKLEQDAYAAKDGHTPSSLGSISIDDTATVLKLVNTYLKDKGHHLKAPATIKGRDIVFSDEKGNHVLNIDQLKTKSQIARTLGKTDGIYGYLGQKLGK